MKNNKNHLPVIGVGPIYVGACFVITALAIVCDIKGYIAVLRISQLKVPLIVVGLILIVAGIFMWRSAVFASSLDTNIKKNHLVTTGIYSWVRNPIYSAFISIFTGILLFCNNIYLLVLPFLYWLIMTVFMINTEEKWLENLYGEEYLEYKKKVNRVIPWKKL